MAFKVTQNHWEVLINFMESHPDLARGRVEGPTGRDTCRKLWTELTIKLNSLGEGERSVQKWQKTWTDFKYVLKRKAADRKSDVVGTGGGPPKVGSLSDFENRILNILGNTFYEGLGRPEYGSGFLKKQGGDITLCDIQSSLEPTLPTAKLCPTAESQLPNEFQNIYTVDMVGTSVDKLPSTSGFKATLKENSEVRTATKKLKRPLLDHDYFTQPKLRKKSKSMEAMYEETIIELKEIKTSVQNLNQTAKGIESALKRIADHFCST